MLVVLLFFAFIRTLQGSPLALPIEASMALDSQDMDDKFGHRDISDIIISCFATIFACTWSAVHPNIPSPWDSEKVSLTLVPMFNESEIILQERPWTLAHGFFVQMGGFMLCEGGRPDPEDEVGILKNIQNGKIDTAMISIPEEDIQDRSKGDTVSKAFIVLQTSWFIIHCIVRWAEDLPLTELEVVTLGFALLNAITYGLWWYKPQNVARPIFLESKISKSQTWDGVHLDSEADYLDRKKSVEEVTAEVGEEPILVDKSRGWLHRKIHEDYEENRSTPYRLLYTMPIRLGEALLRPLGQLTVTGARSHVVKTGSLRVPMFHSEVASDFKVFGATSIIGVLFGSVHLITSWFLDFPSHRDMLLWRASAIVITIQPAFMGLWNIFPTDSWMWHICRSLMVAGLPFYIVGRLVLLTISLLSLRGLPAAAFVNVEWTSFIPHF
ncbi:hypothetical protein BJ912DRAFT_999464 [Pholiota molesta]|nr:hypothetical protein BJ912DRAFT_999464 [Pholiota molesta]